MHTFLSGLNNFINTIIPLVVILSFILIIAGVIGGIVLAFIAAEEKNPKVKNKKIIWSVICFVAPISFLFASIAIWGLVNIADRALYIDPARNIEDGRISPSDNVSEGGEFR